MPSPPRPGDSPGSRLGILNLLLVLGLGLLFVGCSDDDDGPMAPGGSGDPVEETVELLLSARGDEDLPLGRDARGVTTVEVGEDFTLELAYIDHRPMDERLGAYEIMVDLLIDQADVLRPVLGETLRLVIGDEIRSANGAGTITFSSESSAASHRATGADFTADPEGVLVTALSAFGYTRDTDYRLEQMDFGNQDIVLQVVWDNIRYGNLDMPDVLVFADFDVSVPVQTIEYAPFEADGVTQNLAALRFNLDARTRGYNGGAVFFSERVNAEFSSANGFRKLGGTGPSADGGVPELSDDGSFPQPFEVLSLRVEIVAPVTGLRISAALSPSGAGIAMYGQSGAVPVEDIRLDGDHVLTIDAVQP